MERQSGFYWVRQGTEWDIFKYNAERRAWYYAGSDNEWIDEELDEIDEKQITR